MVQGGKTVNSFMKITAGVVIFTIVGAYVLLPIQNAQATDLGGSYVIVLKEYVLDLVARIIAAVIIRTLTNQILGWIQGDDTNFVRHLEKEFRRQVDRRGGEFLNNLTGINLCGNIGAYLQISLRTPGLRQQLECSVTDIVKNVNNFFDNFENGGWQAFMRLSLEPQNNPYGAYFIAWDAKLNIELRAQAAENQNLLSNRGFKGTRSYVKKCEAISAERAEFEVGKPGQEGTICTTEWNTNTPGGLAGDLLSKTVGTGIDFTVVSDEIDEAIAAIAYALIDRLLAEAYSGDPDDEDNLEGGKGIYDPQLSNLPYNLEGGTALPVQIDDYIARIDVTIGIINDAIAGKEEELAECEGTAEEGGESGSGAGLPGESGADQGGGTTDGGAPTGTEPTGSSGTAGRGLGDTPRGGPEAAAEGGFGDQPGSGDPGSGNIHDADPGRGPNGGKFGWISPYLKIFASAKGWLVRIFATDAHAQEDGCGEIAAEIEGFKSKREELVEIRNKLITYRLLLLGQEQQDEDTQRDSKLLQDLSYQLGALLARADEIMAEVGGPRRGSSISSKPGGTVIFIINNALLRGRASLNTLDAKIPRTTDGSEKSRLINLRNEIAGIVARLDEIRNALAATQGSAEINNLTREAFQLIQTLDQKIGEM